MAGDSDWTPPAAMVESAAEAINDKGFFDGWCNAADVKTCQGGDLCPCREIAAAALSASGLGEAVLLLERMEQWFAREDLKGWTDEGSFDECMTLGAEARALLTKLGG